MATKKEGVKCYAKAGETEELFVLRGQDASSPFCVLRWIELNFTNPKMGDGKLREAFECAMNMRNSYHRPAD